MVLIYQPPNAHVRISLRNAMATVTAAVKKIYMYIEVRKTERRIQVLARNHIYEALQVSATQIFFSAASEQYRVYGAKL
jgi:hypothetical protein